MSASDITNLAADLKNHFTTQLSTVNTNINNVNENVNSINASLQSFKKETNEKIDDLFAKFNALELAHNDLKTQVDNADVSMNPVNTSNKRTRSADPYALPVPSDSPHHGARAPSQPPIGSVLRLNNNNNHNNDNRPSKLKISTFPSNLHRAERRKWFDAILDNINYPSDDRELLSLVMPTKLDDNLVIKCPNPDTCKTLRKRLYDSEALKYEDKKLFVSYLKFGAKKVLEIFTGRAVKLLHQIHDANNLGNKPDCCRESGNLYIGSAKVGYIKVTPNEDDDSKHDIVFTPAKDVKTTVPKLDIEDYNRQFQLLTK